MNSNSRLCFLGAWLLCAMTTSANGESPSSGWLEDSQGCKVANPQPQSLESINWSGRCQDGFAEGDGTIHWYTEGRPNGMTSGTFKAGKLMGKGYVTLPQAVYRPVNAASRIVEIRPAWPAGSRLEGEFLENRLIGDGTITTLDGEKILVNEFDGKLVRKLPVVADPALP